MILAWCGELEDDIVTFDDKADFDDCANPQMPHVSGTGSSDVDAFIAIQNTKKVSGSFYFASVANCGNGMKLEIEIGSCN